MVQGILIIVFMLAIMALMVTRKIPTVVALIVLSIGICLIGGVPVIGVDESGAKIGFLDTVIVSGAATISLTPSIRKAVTRSPGANTSPVSLRAVQVFPPTVTEPVPRTLSIGSMTTQVFPMTISALVGWVLLLTYFFTNGFCTLTVIF